MNGQYGIKGYLYQSMIAVLNSLGKKWDHIIVEPNTEFDKVDIIWSSDEVLEVCQVKSSINNFSKNEILGWLENLRRDIKNANSYSILMIGNSSATTKTFFNSIGLQGPENFPLGLQTLFEIKNKINVVFEPDNINTLENALIAELDKFFHTLEISADYPSKKLIVGGMVNQITKISAQGKKMERQEFEQHLLEWITYNYSYQITRKSSALKLSFYLENILDKTFETNKLSLPKINQLQLYKIKIGHLKKLFKEISDYNFESKSYEKLDRFGFNRIGSHLNDELNGYENQQVIESEWNINYVSNLCQLIIGKKPEREFFNFGNLKESKSKAINILYSSKKTHNGTDLEMEKKKLYDKFYWELFETNKLILFWKKLSKFSIIPIIVENMGDQFEEAIKVQLLFPKSVKIYKSKNFPIPKQNQILSDINEDTKLFFDIIRHKKSRQVSEYKSKYNYPQFFEIPSLFGSDNSQKLMKYRRLLDYYFDYEFYEDLEYKIVESCFEGLNNKESISFPSYLFVISNQDFEIRYKITCKNNSNQITGILNYKVCN